MISPEKKTVLFFVVIIACFIFLMVECLKYGMRGYNAGLGAGPAKELVFQPPAGLTLQVFAK